MLDALSCTFDGVVDPAVLTLAPTEFATCTGDYIVTQDDIDAQVLENTATATGSDPTGAPLSQTGTTTYPLDPLDAGIALEKTVASGVVRFTDPGQVITYAIAVENTGNVTLNNVVVTDVLFPGESCTIATLAPMVEDTSSCSFEYTVLQSDIDAGEIVNMASVTAQPATPGSDPVDDSSTVTIDGPTREAEVSIGKAASVTEFDGDMQTIVYTYTVINSGNITLTGAPTVTDDKIVAPNAVTCDAFPAGGLAPTETLECEATYTTTQGDVDAGGVTNVATVTAPNPLGGMLTNDVSLTVPSVRTPELSVTKLASDDADVVAGQTITYAYEVTNTGNVTLTDVTLTDAHTTQAGTANLSIANNVIASLAPDDVTVRTSTYLVTQADIDAGLDLTNTVTASATPPAGATAPTPATADEVVTVEDPDPSLVVLKSVSTLPADLVDGADVQFTVTVENDGNVTLDTITLVDTLRRADGVQVTPSPTAVYDSGDTGVADVLEVGQIWTYLVDYTLTQADVDAGGINNSVLASGLDPSDTPVSDVSDNGAGTGSSPTVIAIAPDPSIETTKRITDGPTTLGAIVRFEIDVENTGNVTLTNVTVTDDGLTRADGTALTLTSGPTFFSADAGSGAGTLQTGETATYRVTYALTQDDIDAGGIANTAQSTATPPIGTPVNDETDIPVTLAIAPEPEIALVKSLTAGGPTFSAVDDVLSYAFEITNTGNITLEDDFTITDPLISDAGGIIVCEPAPLAPDDSLTCTGTYAVTQDDIDAGGVTNTATASNPRATSVPSSTTTPALQTSALAMVKEAISITVDGVTHTDILSEYFVPDAVVRYNYTVTNTGNLTLTDAVDVTDNRIASVDCPALPAGGLAPDGVLVCEADYTVTSLDVRLTVVTNAATALSGGVTTPIATETVPADGEPLLTIVKSLKDVKNPDGSIDAANLFDEVDDTLTYTFVVTNDGEVPFVGDVTVIDTRLDSDVVCFTATDTDPVFGAGETVTCEGIYAINQDDLDAGKVVNEAYAQTLFGVDNVPVISDPSVVTTLVDAAPSIAIEKSAATLPVAAVNQVLTYTLTITNTGNQTLTSVVATDPLIPALDCTIPELAPKGVETCTGTYQVSQDDVDRGSLVNTAAVSAVTPVGGGVGDTTSLTVDMPRAAPALTLSKVGSPDPFGAVGSAVTYVFTAENTGNVTLFDLEITDDFADPGYSCVIARLDVDATDATCSLAYEVTQADVDAGVIVNTATVTGRDPFNTIPPVDARSEIESIPTAGAMEVTKTAVIGGSIAGSPVTFTLQVENTGDLTLDDVAISDTMTRLDGTPITLDTPFAYVSGDANNDDRLDVDETWIFIGVRNLRFQDIDAGGLENTARADAVDPFENEVFDVSDDGNDLDGNMSDDPTVVEIIPGPSINAVKTLQTAGSEAGDTVAFVITATNTGNVTLSDVTPTDTLSRADGAAIDAADVTVTLQGAGAASDPLASGSVRSWIVSYDLTQDDVDAGGLSNTATVSGVSPTDELVSDVSDNGDPSDGNLVDDPTMLPITAAPAFDVVKTIDPIADGVFVQAGEVVSFEIAVTNAGNVTLSDLVLTDTLTRADDAGTALTPDSITLTQGASETEVMVGETLIFTVLYTLQQEDIDAGGIQNTAKVEVVTPSGVPLTNISDDGDDTDGNTSDDPTELAIPQQSGMEATKTADIPTRIGPDLSQVVFTMTVENTGNVTQTNMTIEDNLVPFIAPATLSGPQTVVIGGFDGTGGANPDYNGVSDIDLVTGDISLPPMTTGTIVLTVTYDTSGNNYPEGINTVLAISDLLIAGVSATTDVIGGADPDIAAIKTVTPSNVMLGDTVTYTLTFENRLATREANLTVIDDMPAGVIYTPDSARFDGAATPAPTVSGRQLIWSDVTLEPRQLITITFDARVVGERGEMTNRAYMLDDGGNVVSNIAEATITRRPEAVFECADIIGRVFDDRNMNGYPDGATAPNTNAVSDQTYDGGKGKLAPSADPDTGTPHEPGIPNVRLATVNGTIITTDQNGLFSVPCAELPAAIGSNFTLKLDERSLPTGYRVTTENPRVIRVTPGTAAKLNFGAAISNVVDIDLMAAAFVGETANPTAALVAGVGQLVQQLRDVPSVLRLSYYVNGEGRSIARSRLDMVERLVRDAWRENGRYRLLIERTIQQLQ